MPGKTYYMILGVSETETEGGIRAAYLELAKRLHPDVAGEESTLAFQDVAEAYDVLSNPQRREAYNDGLRRTRDGGTSNNAPRGPPAEPLVRGCHSILGAPEGIRPSERLESLNLEVLLTLDEAARGCLISVGVPVFAWCSRCRGTGHDWVFPCLHCQQQGIIESEVPVPVRIPPLVTPGAVFELPLDGLGIHNFFLRLHVFVEDEGQRWRPTHEQAS